MAKFVTVLDENGNPDRAQTAINLDRVDYIQRSQASNTGNGAPTRPFRIQFFIDGKEILQWTYSLEITRDADFERIIKM